MATIAVVSGASGFIATQLVKQLLEKGKICDPLSVQTHAQVESSVKLCDNLCLVSSLSIITAHGAGYTVRGTVRSAKQSLAKTEVLHALAEALPGNLELHEADLLQEGSLAHIVKGADFVHHCASPFFAASDNPQKDLVRNP